MKATRLIAVFTAGAYIGAVATALVVVAVFSELKRLLTDDEQMFDSALHPGGNQGADAHDQGAHVTEGGCEVLPLGLAAARR